MSSPHCLRGFLITLAFLSLFVFSCGAVHKSSKENYYSDLWTYHSLNKIPETVFTVAEAAEEVAKKVTNNLGTTENFTIAYQKIETLIYNAVNENSFVHQLVEIFQEATGTI